MGSANRQAPVNPRRFAAQAPKCLSDGAHQTVCLARPATPQCMRRAEHRAGDRPSARDRRDHLLRSDQGVLCGLRKRAARAGRSEGSRAICEGQHALDAAFAREPRDRWRDADRDRATEPRACVAGHDDGICHDRKAAPDEGGRGVLGKVGARRRRTIAMTSISSQTLVDAVLCVERMAFQIESGWLKKSTRNNPISSSQCSPCSAMEPPWRKWRWF